MARMLTDADVVSRCRGGDEAAWAELVARFSRYVHAIATQGFRLPPQDVEDVFQDVFARVYANLGKLRDDGAVRPWIAQVTRRLCLDRVARGAATEPLGELELADEDRLGELEEAFDLHDALDGLPEHCREILDRFFARDESYRTIGEALDLPAGTVASRISRCLARLRARLEGRNPEPDVSGHLMGNERTIDEERIARLLRLLPPAPPGWVQAAAELPFLRPQLDELVARAEADAGFRAALVADLEAALQRAGYEPRAPLVAALRRRLAQA